MRKTLLLLSIAFAACGGGTSVSPSSGHAVTSIASTDGARRLPSCASMPAPRHAARVSLEDPGSGGRITVHVNGIAVCAGEGDEVDQYLTGLSGGFESRIAPGQSDPMPASGDDPTPGSDGTGNGSGRTNSDPMPAKP